jgi:tRNA(Arg) A34 adenosine deaminase TadA
MSRVQKMFRLAKREAFKSDSKHRHGAILAKSTRVYNSSYNINRYCQFADHHREDAGHGTLHAEIGAILGIDRKKLTGSDVYVIRLSANDELAYSRPCEMCQQVMRHVGVKRCYYSISKDEWGVLRL